MTFMTTARAPEFNVHIGFGCVTLSLFVFSWGFGRDVEDDTIFIKIGPITVARHIF